MKSCHNKNPFPAKLNVRMDVPLKPYTSFKVGGPADYFVQPGDMRALGQVVEIARSNGIPCTIMGGGTNILVRDRGIRGVVISLAGFKNEISIQLQSNDHKNNNGNENSQYMVTASAGTILARLCRKTMSEGLGDLSFAAGIPGTVGGAIAMNAGTGTGTISSHLQSIEVLDGDGTIKTVAKDQLYFSHRHLEFSASSLGSREMQQNDRVKKNGVLKEKNAKAISTAKLPIILKGSFLLQKTDRQKIMESWQAIMEKRKLSQPHGLPCAGCFFKNPAGGKPAGELIDMAGLKKRRVGDAMVSDIHANFIVNLGNASAGDILALMDIITARVEKDFGIILASEVTIKGE
ncbi:MAG: UDP-N-acetylmuramate dehydrogenase [Desulfamplus sp.]|nr:UDP-N-acetylmuramate dehydrogenase [Desulfamplus sp.]